MRRLPTKRRHWLDRKSRRGHIRKRNLRERRKALRYAKVFGVSHHDKVKIVSLYGSGETHYAVLTGEPIPVPATLRLIPTHWLDTIDLITSLRSMLLEHLTDGRNVLYHRQGHRVPFLRSYWDFSTLRTISLEAALLLAAEYDRARYFRGFVPKAIDIHTWDKVVVSTLSMIGFFDLVGVEPSTIRTTDLPDGRMLRMRRGDDADGMVIVEYLRMLGVDLVEEDPALSEAIMEAITNCVQHAYADPSLLQPSTLKAWWISAQLRKDADGRMLRIALYDQGATIPATLPQWDRYPFVLRMFKTLHTSAGEEPDPHDSRFDGEAIRLAIEVGRSSVGQQGRGQGLRQVVDALDLCKEGIVTIFSRRGAFQQQKGKAARTWNNPTPLLGTMVTWHLRF